MATMILRPVSDIDGATVDKVLSPSSGTTLYNLVNDISPDGDSTYIYKTINTTYTYATSIGFMLTSIPFSFQLSKVKVVVVAKKTVSKHTGDFIFSVDKMYTGQSYNLLAHFEKSLSSSGSYETLVCEAEVSKYIESMYDLSLTITDNYKKASSKNDDGETRITQAYVEIEYEKDAESGTSLYIKSNGSYSEAQKVYKKVNGVYVEQTDISSLFSTSRKYVKGS